MGNSEEFQALQEQAKLYEDPTKTVPPIKELENLLSLIGRFIFRNFAAARRGEKEMWSPEECAVIQQLQAGILTSASKYYSLLVSEHHTSEDTLVLANIKCLQGQIERVFGKPMDPTAAASLPPATPLPEDPTL